MIILDFMDFFNVIHLLYYYSLRGGIHYKGLFYSFDEVSGLFCNSQFSDHLEKWKLNP